LATRTITVTQLTSTETRAQMLTRLYALIPSTVWENKSDMRIVVHFAATENTNVLKYVGLNGNANNKYYNFSGFAGVNNILNFVKIYFYNGTGNMYYGLDNANLVDVGSPAERNDATSIDFIY
jgi:hypothetical protein